MTTIIFDLLGVIIDEENIASKRLFHYLNNPTVSSEELKMRYAEGLKIGKLTHEEFWRPYVNDGWEEFERQFLNSLKISPDAYDVLKKLKEQYKIGAVSEIPTKWAEAILSNHKILPLFDVMVLSDEYGTTKGGDELFNAIKNKMSTGFENMVYIDDKVKNLVAPKRLGMKTVWFKRNQQDVVIDPDAIVTNLDEFYSLVSTRDSHLLS